MVFISIIKITKESKDLTALFFTGVYSSVNCLFMSFDLFTLGSEDPFCSSLLLMLIHCQ